MTINALDAALLTSYTMAGTLSLLCYALTVMSLWSRLLQLIQYISRAKDSTQQINSYPQKLSTGQPKENIIKRHAVLTSTFSYVFDKVAMLSEQSLSKAHRGRIKRTARGVLLAFGIALCFPTDAGSTSAKEYISYKEYSLYLLDFNIKEYKCLAALYGKESAWNPDAVNGSHYGIPQGRSVYLSTLNGYDQVQWGLDYIGHRYGEPCIAWEHFKRKGWH